jgi:carbon storage regulator
VLILSRKRDESIVIADVIRIVVVEIRGDKVRLGIQAPKDIDVHRFEIWEAIKAAIGSGEIDIAQGSVGVTEGQPSQCGIDSGDRVHECCGNPACGRNQEQEAGPATGG